MVRRESYSFQDGQNRASSARKLHGARPGYQSFHHPAFCTDPGKPPLSRATASDNAVTILPRASLRPQTRPRTRAFFESLPLPLLYPSSTDPFTTPCSLFSPFPPTRSVSTHATVLRCRSCNFRPLCTQIAS